MMLRFLFCAFSSPRSPVAFGLMVVACVGLLTPAAFAVIQTPPASFADLVEDLNPAVVNISTKKKIAQKNNLESILPFEELPEGHPFEHFGDLFKHFLQPEMLPDQELQSLGSGFIIDAEGHVVTNNHVIDGAEEITVTLDDDTRYDATIIGTDKKTDLALLKIESDTPLPFVPFGDSDVVRVGDWVVVIGNPFGLGGTVTTGIVSARARDINAGPFDDFIQTDAAINRGNSGGPLFNLEGEVIGINTAIYSPAGVGNIGIGFAVPSAMAKSVIVQLKEKGMVERGWLGVRIQEVTEDIALSLGLSGPDAEDGALVVEVIADSPAQEAGIEVGDIIRQFDGKSVRRMRDLPRIVAETPIGGEVAIELLRSNGRKRMLEVTVGRLEEEEAEQEMGRNDAEQEERTVLGMVVASVDAQARKQWKLGEEVEGLVIVRVERTSEAYRRGLRAGDVLVAANHTPLADVDTLEEEVESARKKDRKTLLLLVSREGQTLFQALPLDAAKDE